MVVTVIITSKFFMDAKSEQATADWSDDEKDRDIIDLTETSSEMDMDSEQSDSEYDEKDIETIEEGWSRLLDHWRREGVPRNLSLARILRTLGEATRDVREEPDTGSPLRGQQRDPEGEHRLREQGSPIVRDLRNTEAPGAPQGRRRLQRINADGGTTVAPQVLNFNRD